MPVRRPVNCQQHITGFELGVRGRRAWENLDECDSAVFCDLWRSRTSLITSAS